MKQILSTAAMACALFLCSCASKPAKAPAGTLNAKCPISGESLDGKGPTIFFNQDTIGFCCEKCVAKFAKLSGEEKQQKINAVK